MCRNCYGFNVTIDVCELQLYELDVILLCPIKYGIFSSFSCHVCYKTMVSVVFKYGMENYTYNLSEYQEGTKYF